MEDYKEKLRLAKEALDSGSYDRETIEYIFPELKENEDKSIKKSLIGHLKECRNNTRSEVMLGEYAKWIAWLEKQGEQKFSSLSEKEIVCLKRILDFLRKEHNSYTGEDFTNEIIVLEWLITHPVLIHSSELQQNQSEQKSTDKVEPKFKAGDWITNGIDFTFQVSSIEDNMYLRSDGYFIDIETADKIFRLWTIKDAKYGDILYEQETKSILLVHGRSGNWLQTLCDYWMVKEKFHVEFPYENYGLVQEMSLVPANKEQRDLLFKKMKEAGYEWDTEKKELKKIEQEDTELPKGEDYTIDGLWQAIQILEHSLGEVDGWQSDDGILEHKCAIEAVKRLYKQKPAWSEKDEYVFSKVLNWMLIVNPTSSIFEKLPKEQFIERFKSFKERIKGE